MKLFVFYIIIVASLILIVVKQSHTGNLDYGVLDESVLTIEIGHRTNDKAIFNGKEVDYYAASFERCDELYKYCHCIGQGYVQGFKNPVYLYVPNDNYRLITTDQLLAEQKSNLKIQ